MDEDEKERWAIRDQGFNSGIARAAEIARSWMREYSKGTHRRLGSIEEIGEELARRIEREEVRG